MLKTKRIRGRAEDRRQNLEYRIQSFVIASGVAALNQESPVASHRSKGSERESPVRSYRSKSHRSRVIGRESQSKVKSGLLSPDFCLLTSVFCSVSCLLPPVLPRHFRASKNVGNHSIRSCPIKFGFSAQAQSMAQHRTRHVAHVVRRRKLTTANCR